MPQSHMNESSLASQQGSRQCSPGRTQLTFNIITTPFVLEALGVPDLLENVMREDIEWQQDDAD
jgi:hypothetical protein